MTGLDSSSPSSFFTIPVKLAASLLAFFAPEGGDPESEASLFDILSLNLFRLI